MVLNSVILCYHQEKNKGFEDFPSLNPVYQLPIPYIVAQRWYRYYYMLYYISLSRLRLI
jgi:hypothetical protein